MFFAQFLLQSKLSTSEGSSMTRVRPSNCHPTDKHPKALRTWLLCMPLAFCYLPLRQPGSKLNSAHYSYCKQVFSQASRISCCRVVGKYWWRTWLLCIDAEPDYSACHSPLATCHRGNQAGALNYSPHWLNRRPRRGLTTRLSGGRLEICQKIYTTGFVGNKFYTLKKCILRRFLLKKRQRKCINISYFSKSYVRI